MPDRLLAVFCLHWLLLLLSCALTSEASATDEETTPSPFSSLEQDGNTWMSGHFFHFLDEEKKWKLYTGGDLRFVDNSRTLRRARGRLGAFYRVNEQIQIALAYDYVRQIDPSANESRLWAQIQYYQPSDGLWRFDYRFRIEQRLIQDVSGVVWRSRFRFNAKSWLFGEERWYYRGWNEIFLNANTRPEFAQNHFAQYRIFNGIGYTPDNDSTRYEGGYQLRYITNTMGADRLDHTLFMQMYKYF